MNGKHLGLHSDSYCGVGAGDVALELFWSSVPCWGTTNKQNIVMLSW